MKIKNVNQIHPLDIYPIHSSKDIIIEGIISNDNPEIIRIFFYKDINPDEDIKYYYINIDTMKELEGSDILDNNQRNIMNSKLSDIDLKEFFDSNYKYLYNTFKDNKDICDSYKDKFKSLGI